MTPQQARRIFTPVARKCLVDIRDAADRALGQLDRGEVPSASLVELVTRYDRAQAHLDLLNDLERGSDD